MTCLKSIKSNYSSLLVLSINELKQVKDKISRPNGYFHTKQLQKLLILTKIHYDFKINKPIRQVFFNLLGILPAMVASTDNTHRY